MAVVRKLLIARAVPQELAPLEELLPQPMASLVDRTPLLEELPLAPLIPGLRVDLAAHPVLKLTAPPLA